MIQREKPSTQSPLQYERRREENQAREESGGIGSWIPHARERLAIEEVVSFLQEHVRALSAFRPAVQVNPVAADT